MNEQLTKTAIKQIDFKTEKPYLHHPFGVEISEREWSGWNWLEYDLGLEPLHIPLTYEKA